MNAISRILDHPVVIPALVGVAYLGLIATSDVTPGVAILVIVFMGIVLLLWSGYRALSLHASASRHAAMGEPEELLVLADRQVNRRFRSAARQPFHIYRAIALEMTGDRDAAREALTKVDLMALRPNVRRPWTVLHAALRITLHGHDGDGAGARKILEEELRPALKAVWGPGAEIVQREAEARVLHAEGKLDEARPLLEALAKDIRLGPATRAACKYLLGDKEAAAKLAPRTWMARPQ